MNNIKITGFEIKAISFPLVNPITNHQRTLTQSQGLLCLLETNVGINGQGLVYGLGQIDYKKVRFFSEMLSSKIINQAIVSPEYFFQKMLDIKLPKCFEFNNTISAIDIAVWDIYLKEKGFCLRDIFNSNKKKSVPVYDTAGWLSLSINELIRNCQENTAKGIYSYKIRLGHINDDERVSAIRKAMGNDFILMADANQRYTVNEAASVIARLKDFNLLWIEEPVGNSLEELKHLKALNIIPIAMGENIDSQNIFEEICKNKMVDFLQPDIRCCMGLTKYIEICRLSQAYSIPLCSHLMQELSCSLIAGSSSGFMVEYLDIIPPEAFTQDFSIHAGHIQIPTVSGTGVELTSKAILEYCL